jgi:hypothetical protein
VSILTRKQVTAILLFGMSMGVVGLIDGRAWMRAAAAIELVCITVYTLLVIWWPAEWRDQ